MTTYRLILFNPAPALSVRAQIDRLVESRDTQGWNKLHQSLSHIHRSPSLSMGNVHASEKPLTQCSYFSSAADLKPDEFPNRRSIDWVIKTLIEMTSRDRCHGGWFKFASDFDIHVHDHVLTRHPQLAVAHEEFTQSIVNQQQSERDDLKFLRNPDAYCSITTQPTLLRLVEAQDQTGHLKTCADVFNSLSEPIWRHFAADIKRLELFVRIAALNERNVLWFECMAT